MGYSDRGYSSGDSSTFMAEWTAVITLVVINVALWVANLVLAGDIPISRFLALQGDLPQHLLKVWELVTYGFVHADEPSHLLFNMLALWFFGREVEAIMGRGEFFRVYVTAIVLAGVAWVASVQVGQPLAAPRTFLVGASGAVMAVLAVFVWYFPRQTVYIWGVLPVPAWALGILYVVSDAQGAASHSGNVAHVAHLAGAAFGLMYAWRGWHLGGLGDLSESWRRRRRMRVVRPDDDGRESGSHRRSKVDDDTLQEEVDRILEKISRSGEASLTAKERDTLTRASENFRARR